MTCNSFKFLAGLCAAAMLGMAAMAQVVAAQTTLNAQSLTLTLSRPSAPRPQQSGATYSVVGAADNTYIGESTIVGMSPVKLEKGTFLGIGIAPVTPDLAAQLKLPPGIGLVVQSVVDGSPADDAGIKPHDVLDKLDDQILIQPVQMVVLVRMHKPADQIKLSVIHEGTRGDKTIKLAEKDVLPVEVEIQPMYNQCYQTAGMVNVIAGTVTYNAVAIPGLPIPEGGTEVDWTNPRHHLTLGVKDGKPVDLRVMDNSSGKCLFVGPVATDDDRKKIPADLKDEFDRMLQEVNNPHLNSASSLDDGTWMETTTNRVTTTPK